MGDKIIIGLTEHVKLNGTDDNEELIARIDTGATKSSIDLTLASKLKLGPIIKSKMVKSAHGNRLRPVVEAEIEIKGKKILSEFTLADRDHMKYKILVGQNILKEGFLIDPQLE
jgi:hypothetical protein